MQNNKVTWICMGMAGLLAAGVAGCSSKSDQPTSNARTIKVSVAQPQKRVFRQTVRVQGSIAAKNRARLAALAPGTIEELFVDEGAAVSQGQQLFQTDKVNLENKVQIERDNLRVAAASRVEAEAALAEAEAVFIKTELDFHRFKKLYEKDQAVTLDAYERTETAFKRAEAGRQHARAMVDLAVAREAQAQSALHIVEKQLADSLVRAPFDGIITRKLLDRGEYASAGAPVLALEDPRELEAVFVLGADYYDRIHTNHTQTALLRNGQAVPVELYYKAPSVYPITRTFELKARLPETGGFAPGMLCEVEATIQESEGWAIPTPAIGIRNNQPVVFTAENGQARMHPVQVGLPNNGFTELRDPGALLDKNIIVEGQAFLNDQDAIRLE